MKLPSLFSRPDSNLVERDVDALMEAFGDDAYDEARTREREVRLGKTIDGNRPLGHWDKVRKEIARRSGKQIGMDTATRYVDKGK